MILTSGRHTVRVRTTAKLNTEGVQCRQMTTVWMNWGKKKLIEAEKWSRRLERERE